ncbi:MAG: hypothetical protein ACKVQR_05300 [Aquabacterium sp.]
MRRAAACLGTRLAAVAMLVLSGCATSPAPAPQPPAAPAAATQARDLTQRANARYAADRAHEAIPLYREALARADSLEQHALSGTIRLNLATALTRTRRYDEARAALQPLIQDPHRVFGRELHERGLQRLVLVDLAQGRLDDVERGALLYECPANDCRNGAAMANARASVALHAQRPEQAESAARRALTLADQHLQPRERAQALLLAGRAQAALSRHDEAAASLQLALQGFQQAGPPEGVAASLLAAADNETRRGRAADAAMLRERARQVYGQAGRLDLVQQMLMLDISAPRP